VSPRSGSSEARALTRRGERQNRRRDGRPKLRGELRTAAVKIQRMVALRLEIACAPIAAQCVKQSSLPSRASTNARTATKIFSEDRPAAGRLSIVKIAPSALDHHRGITRAAEFPDRERRCVCQREYDSLRTKLHTRVFTAVFIGGPCVNTICDRLGPVLNVTLSAF
jgi:hypothetical protein